MSDFVTIVNDKLWEEYLKERQKGADTPEMVEKFPMNVETGEVFRNKFRTERLPFEKSPDGAMEATEKDKWLEILPSEITGEFDVRIRAMSTIPVSQALEEARVLETFNLTAQLPYTDLYKAQRNLYKSRHVDPDEWMIPEEQIMKTQEQAQAGAEMQGEAQGGGVPTVVPPSKLEQPAARGGISSQFAKSLGV
jgi:hypothetical protein